MANEFPTDPTGLFLTLIISGGIVAGIFEWIRNTLSQRREEYMDIAKTKIEYISKSIPYYAKMIYFYNSFNRHTKKAEESQDQSDEKLTAIKMALFSVCNILHLREEFFQAFGAPQLDNIEAENIIQITGDKFARIIREGMTPRSQSILRTVLIKDQEDNLLPYHEYEDNLQYYPVLSEFQNKILSDEKAMKELRKMSQQYIEVIGFEVNHNYRIWYGEDQNFQNLSRDIVESLKDEYPHYYDRIKSFNERKFSKPSTWLKRTVLPNVENRNEEVNRIKMQYRSFLHRITIILAIFIFVFFLSFVLLFF